MPGLVTILVFSRTLSLQDIEATALSNVNEMSGIVTDVLNRCSHERNESVWLKPTNLVYNLLKLKDLPAISPYLDATVNVYE